MTDPIDGGEKTMSESEPVEGGCGCGRHRHASPGGATPGERPAWAVAPAVRQTLDARPMLAAGEHPVGQVLAMLGTLEGEEVLQLLTPFVPEPLIDRVRGRVRGRGFAAYSAVEEPGLVRTFFRREQA